MYWNKILNSFKKTSGKVHSYIICILNNRFY